MRKRIVLLLLVLLLLPGCKGKGDIEATETVSPNWLTTQQPTHVSEEPTTAEPPIAQDETALALQQMSSDICRVDAYYFHEGTPRFYPVNDHNMERFVTFISQEHGWFDDMQFERYGATAGSYGFGVQLRAPVDYWGRPYFMWFEVMPSNNLMIRNTLVSAGPDGVFTYVGMGADYSQGFGDDLMTSIEYDDYLYLAESEE